MHRDAPLSDAAAIRHIAAYVRVSTDEQRQSGLGLEDQRARCVAMAGAKGWPTPEVFADEGISGTKEPEERPALGHLLAEVKAGRIDAVITLSYDRLARRTRYVLDLVETFNQAGVALISCKENLDTSTPHGQFMLTQFAALAQLERDLIAQRTQAALDVLGRTTGDKGGKLPYGYRRHSHGGPVTINRAEAALVRRIFAWHRRGFSLRDIARRVNESGVASPRGKGRWGHTTVAEILGNRLMYLGAYRASSTVRWPVLLGKHAEGDDADSARRSA